MLAEKDTYIHHAYQQLQVISQNKEKRLEYETREKAIRDHNQLMLEAKQQGRAEGRKEGRAEGRKEGRAEGRKEGRVEGRKEGRVEGKKEGREEGIQAMILDNLEEGISKERILVKLQKRFSLTEEKANDYYGKFMKND